MSENIIKLLGICSLCFLLLGCTNDSVMIDVKPGSSEENTSIHTEVTLEDVGKDEEHVEEHISASNEKNEVMDKKVEEELTVMVHICGAVAKPGVYILPYGSRLYEGIEMAGGFRSDSDMEFLNLAYLLEDGTQIIIPTIDEAAEMRSSQTEGEDTLIKRANQDSNAGSKTEGKVNINTADIASLCTLPGIGESRARSIIEYRTSNGKFETTEDIMNVAGIKDAAYNRIKELITINIITGYLIL